LATSGTEPNFVVVPRPGKDYALLIAINDYQNPKLADFSNPQGNPKKDAEEIEQLLKTHYGFITEPLLNNPTAADITAKLEQYERDFRSGAKDPNGQLFLFFSGHGEREYGNGFFLAADADPTKLYEKSIPYALWRPRIANFNCKHIMVVIDACYSGTFDPNWFNRPKSYGTRSGELDATAKLQANYDAKKTRMFFTSATEVQSPEISSFAKKLKEGLLSGGGTDGILTSTELFSSLELSSPRPHRGEFEQDEAGSAYLFFSQKTNNPSPDTDGDGVPDARDECPRLYAKTPSGCPDADEDGIPDPQDKCPYEPGPASNGGCPTQAADGDGDGIPDVGDACPTEKGLARFAGCPDTDSDGVPDKDDNCPRQSGPASNRGCPLAPDRDRDGVPDNTDRCPDQFGPASNNGCPLLPPVPTGMVLVQGGTFQMGDVMGDKEQADETLHTVTVSNFLLAKNELTFEEYDAFCKATGRELPSDHGWGRGKRPVSHVDWYDAVEYCNWRSSQEGLQAVYSINKNSVDSNNSSTSDSKKWLVTTNRSTNGYRLPTEAEWEYAARQRGQKVRFGNGKDIADPKEINFDASSSYKKPYSIAGAYREKTLPVGSFSPNTLDLFDMSGNVWEWCGDWYGTYPGRATNDPQGDTGGSRRVFRGGSWGGSPAFVRVAFRGRDTPDRRNSVIGFRLARAAVAL
jgi:formylglycine-generating enzyme required for sulfatase activity